MTRNKWFKFSFKSGNHLIVSKEYISFRKIIKEKQRRKNQKYLACAEAESRADTGKENTNFISIFSELTHWKRLCCWEGLGARGEGDDRGWDGWTASLTQWTCVSVNSGSWWWTGRPGILRFMGSQRVGHDWATDLIWSDLSEYEWLMLYDNEQWEVCETKIIPNNLRWYIVFCPSNIFLIMKIKSINKKLIYL